MRIILSSSRSPHSRGRTLLLSDQVPRLPRFPTQKRRCGGITDNLLLGGVPLDLATRPQRDVPKVGDRRGSVPDFHVGGRTPSRPYTLDEVLDVQVRRVLRDHLLRTHARLWGGSCLPQGGLKLGIDLEPEPVREDRAVRPVKGLAMRAIVLSPGPVVGLARSPSAEAMPVQTVRLVAQDEPWVFVVDLHDVGNVGAVLE